MSELSGIEKSAKNKYAWQIYIDGLLFADLTGFAQDRRFTKTRNKPDEISFTLNLDKLEAYARLLKVNAIDILQAGVSEIRVSRYGVVLTAGQLVQWDADLLNDRVITLTFRGWYNLLNYRTSTTTYTSKTALQIIQDQIAVTQAKSFGSFGLAFGLVPTTDTTNLYPTKVYTDKLIYEIFQELSQENNGFDFEFTWDKKINVYHPQQGITREDIVFSYPGNIKNIKVSNDATKIVNNLTGRGAGYGLGQVTPQIVSDTDSKQRYMLREGFVDFPDVEDTVQLLNLTTAEKDLFKSPVILHEVTLDGSRDPQVGSFLIGDSVRTSVSSVLNLYSGLNDFFRIDSFSVDLGEEGEETVNASLS